MLFVILIWKLKIPKFVFSSLFMLDNSTLGFNHILFFENGPLRTFSRALNASSLADGIISWPST